MTDTLRDAPSPRPLPHPSALTRPFWDGCRQHQLLIQHCETCGAHLFYPRASCPVCGSQELSWVRASGNASLHTFTVARRVTHRLLADRVPYVIALVDLDEGPRLTSTVLTPGDPAELRIGQRLVVDFEDHEELSLPVFRPAAPEGEPA